MVENSGGRKIPFVRIPGRHITADEATKAVIAGVCHGIAFYSGTPEIPALILNGFGMAISFTTNDLMVFEAMDKNEENL
ncbi:MAG: hypothetical protein UR39_C0003G0137 [Candidatus Woesebacteria bacterium GW2011_GWA1_33_30]|uniref:Uncharacterized protein n=1 Tax=Candidatus Woesebacteria bacterium GW2011_GWA2_33_28 TaxID=1618561 RepID=A0A0G0C984_9BACT|nr:MAG: hypothetical protein UR38_C0003G0140 [Candidatus Woesebacteria bacterium GW2011_GWA2_33_28]KKP48602.1 MAG: hypothetical protein UR39_C0003G0137 [Candidatus Woesebacteria bacterium GW2011_GWA1_33_30]KKP49741.1 MAG: hypothetical protein UR40_C0004G0140 [Microgenomates group bacterium GW2011_GWC1_33_32]KKP52358.1 MAG: hypothetical protein UR44_C0003G0140 [Candidatus Woesebacteria bacterium GW2011_GWB1_33_38]KKP57041.1 MAG: hypothetical protein UR48_C0024G0004 [Microgenomates group bacteriu